MKIPRLLPLVIGVTALTSWLAVRAEEAKPAAVPAVVAPEKLAEPGLDNGYLKLGFEQLASYGFTPPAFDPTSDAQAVPQTG